jgi:hypothetical protein
MSHNIRKNTFCDIILGVMSFYKYVEKWWKCVRPTSSDSNEALVIPGSTRNPGHQNGHTQIWILNQVQDDS